MSNTRTDVHAVYDAEGNVVESSEVVVDITEEVNQSAIEENLAQDLEVMQTILDTDNAALNVAAAVKDIARMNKRLGHTAIQDYSDVD